MLYCPETVLSLVGVLRKLSACQEIQRAPDAYIAFTIRNPETCQLLTTELGEPGAPGQAAVSERPAASLHWPHTVLQGGQKPGK